MPLSNEHKSPPTYTKQRLVQAQSGNCTAVFRIFWDRCFFVVLNAGLGNRDALVEGKRGSFMSVIVHSVHNNIVPHIATHAVCLM